MIKKILSILLIVVIVGLVPLVSGCGPEGTSTTQTETKRQVGPPTEVVE